MAKLEHLEKVENTLYKRILRNAYVGAAKSALIGIAIGCTVGALLCGAVFAFPALAAFVPFTIAHSFLGIAVVAAKVGLGLGVITAGYGSIAAVQSTRDARRVIGADRLPTLTPSQEHDRQQLFQMMSTLPEAARETEQTQNSAFQDLLKKQAEQNTTGVVRQ